jgi:hypothetical protein
MLPLALLGPKLALMAGQYAGYFLKYWKEIIIVILIGFILYQNNMETRILFTIDTIPYYQKQLQLSTDEVDQTTLALESCATGNQALSQAIRIQNDEIIKWKTTTTELEEQRNDLITKISNVHSQVAIDVQDILNTPTPKSCKDAVDYLRTGVGDLKW